jgi:hypothetical protein
MSTRYATIIIGDDGREVVSAIGLFEGAAPDLPAGRVEAVGAGVLIGIVRGGPVDAAGGFGFPSGSAGVNGREIGLASLNKPRPVKHEDEPAAIARSGARAPAAAKRKARAKPKRAKPRKARKAGQGRDGGPRAAEGSVHG